MIMTTLILESACTTHTRTDGRQLQEKSNNQSATIGDFSVSLSVASGKRNGFNDKSGSADVIARVSSGVCQYVIYATINSIYRGQNKSRFRDKKRR